MMPFPETTAVLDEHADAFESAFSDGGAAPRIEEFLPPEDDSHYLDVLCELVRIEMDRGWTVGQGTRLKQYASRFPRLFENRQFLLDVAFEEYRQRLLAGEETEPSEYGDLYGLDVSDWPLTDSACAKLPPSGPAPASTGNCRGADDTVKPKSSLQMNAKRHGVPPEQTVCYESISLMARERAGTKAPPRPPSAAGVSSLHDEDTRRSGKQAENRPGHGPDDRTSENKPAVPELAGLTNLKRAYEGGLPPTAVPADLPSVGDEIFGFRLKHELGQGAFARVYLAVQTELADRPVVLKVSGMHSNEPQTLARLQHTNIVPIHSVHENPTKALRAVCMPYFGGASLSRILELIWDQGLPASSGSQLVKGLADTAARPADAAPTSPSENESALLRRMEKMTWVQACSWIVARLADGLQHAHDRGVLHRDIKPANVLLTQDGQPMLLDFNLSKSRADGVAAATIGGTVAYMSPEHLRALGATRSDPATAVDERSDVYSLGLVLFEMIAGCRAFQPNPSYLQMPVARRFEVMAADRSNARPSLRELRHDVPWSLESIVRRCLEPDPARRYQKAAELAEDLRRFLEDLPLRFAPELSHRERIEKWFRRHPRASSGATVASVSAVLLAVAVFSLVGVQRHLERTRSLLQVSLDHERREAFEDGTIHALCLVSTTTERHDTLEAGSRWCERTLDLFHVLDDTAWQNRPEWQRLSAVDRLRYSEDVRELLVLKAWADVRRSPGNPPALSAAIDLLAKAEQIEGLSLSPAVLTDRAYYLREMGRLAESSTAQADAARIKPRTARDHYLLATAMLRNGGEGRHARALPALHLAIGLNPHHYWSLLERGICHLELGQETLAISDFAVCIGLAPDLPWGYFNRGVALDRTGHKVEAIADYSAALSRDPVFVPAWLNRALALLELQRFNDALDDFELVASREHDDAVVNIGKGIALEGLSRHAEADEVFKSGLALLDEKPAEARIRLLWAYGFAISTRCPELAEKAFDTVLTQQPDNRQALYGRAMLAMNQNDIKALTYFDRALSASPGFVEARRYRGVMLARQGRFNEARDDIRRCLELQPDSGASLYAAACVASLSAERQANPTAQSADVSHALKMLKQALARGYGLKQAPTDPDLAFLRKSKEFRALATDLTLSIKEAAH